jgi:hypothetical protein
MFDSTCLRLSKPGIRLTKMELHGEVSQPHYHSAVERVLVFAVDDLMGHLVFKRNSRLLPA